MAQLQALGWDYYLFGGELARQYPGACVRARTLEVLCSVMHEQQVGCAWQCCRVGQFQAHSERGCMFAAAETDWRVCAVQVMVATDGADVLALLGPEDFMAKYQHTQVWKHGQTPAWQVLNIRACGGTKGGRL